MGMEKLIKLTDKYGNLIGWIEKYKLPIKIEDTLEKKEYFVKQGTKKDSGLYMNNQAEGKEK